MRKMLTHLDATVIVCQRGVHLTEFCTVGQLLRIKLVNIASFCWLLVSDQDWQEHAVEAEERSQVRKSTGRIRPWYLKAATQLTQLESRVGCMIPQWHAVRVCAVRLACYRLC